MEDRNKPEISWWQPGMALFLKLSGWIGGPAILGVLVGQHLDQKYHTQPWLLLLSVAVTFTASIMMLMKIWKEEIERIDKENKR
jgi:F0F1-type ATP synthase assembly protein I